MSYSKGSNSMYQEYESLKESSKNMRLGIANIRGRKPVLRDIKKAREIINRLLIEINPCAGKEGLKQCDKILLSILNEND